RVNPSSEASRGPSTVSTVPAPLDAVVCAAPSTDLKSAAAMPAAAVRFRNSRRVVTNRSPNARRAVYGVRYAKSLLLGPVVLVAAPPRPGGVTPSTYVSLLSVVIAVQSQSRDASVGRAAQGIAMFGTCYRSSGAHFAAVAAAIAAGLLTLGGCAQ